MNGRVEHGAEGPHPLPGVPLDLVQAPCGLLIVQDDHVILDANARLAEMVGASVESLRGQAVEVLFRQAPRLLWHSYVLPLLKLHGRVDEIDLPLKCAQGGPRGSEVDTLLCATRDPATGHVHCAFFPLRERRRLEDELFNAKRAADQVPGMLFQLRRGPDARLSLSYCSDACLLLYGVSARQAREDIQTLWDAIEPEDQGAVFETLARSAADWQSWRVEYRVRRRGTAADQGPADGAERVWLETHAVPRRERDGSVVWHGYTSDVTERKRLEGVERAKEAAEQATRAKSDFLARMSHELRTPLNAILGFSQLMRLGADGALAEGHLHKLGHIELAGRSLLGLIDELLDISRIEAGRMELSLGAVSVDAALDHALRLTETQARERGITVQAQRLQGAAVRADARRLPQVLVNLVSNAIKYNRPGGVVDVAVAGEGRGATEQVRISILDQGPGLTAEQQAALFQPFNRLGAEQGATQGTGLGLVITRQLVELMGGRLELHSEPGQGACFSVVLPRAASAGADAGDTSHPAPRP